MLAGGRFLRTSCDQLLPLVTRCDQNLRRRCLYLAPPFLVEDYEPAAVATARAEGAMATKLDQGTEDFLEWQFNRTTIDGS